MSNDGPFGQHHDDVERGVSGAGQGGREVHRVGAAMAGHITDHESHVASLGQ
jgi:hypothetical protein